jgi:hypothetical protein
VPVGSSLTDKYSTRGDGVYDITIVTPQNTPEISAQEFNKNLHNPFVDELVVGLRAAVRRPRRPRRRRDPSAT